MNLGLNVALIPRLGIKGAALATLISSFFSFCAYMYFSQKLYCVPHSLKTWLAGLAGCICVIAISLIYYHTVFDLRQIAGKLFYAGWIWLFFAALMLQREEWRQIGAAVLNRKGIN